MPGGSIPAGNLVHVGLAQDVWDWHVVSNQMITTGGSITAPLMGFHEWSNTVVTGTPPSEGGQEMGGTEVVRARGIAVHGLDTMNETVTRLMLADVTGMKLGLSDLNRQMLV